MKDNWFDKCESVKVMEDVSICNPDGSVREVVKVEVSALRAPDGEIYLDGEALAKLDHVKARLEGIMLPEDIKKLRERFGLSQTEISNALGLGGKTWTRWETGRERPSRSMNNMLVFLHNGKLTLEDFEHVAIREDAPEDPPAKGPRTRARAYA